MKMSSRTKFRDDYDAFQPCFFESEVEEDFYDTPAPSEDIWKKFELLPTPPRSPNREPQDYDLSPEAEKLEIGLLNFLGDTECHMLHDDDPVCQTVLFPESCEACCKKAKSNLIQDCMWSGLTKDPESKNSENSVDKTEKDNERAKDNTVCVSKVDVANVVSTDCVDPATVFPYPLNDRRHSLGTETPSDSEDEEIDVVTVAEKKQAPPKRKLVIPATNYQMCAAVAAMHNYTQPSSRQVVPTVTLTTTVLQPSESRISQKRSYASSAPGSPSTPDGGKAKKSRQESSVHIKTSSSAHKYKSGYGSRPNSRPSSDSEDSEGKRTQHNVLERKRRDDLKNSFLSLRDNVPELHCQERAAKVVILKKATDHINSLIKQEQTLKRELDIQKQRKEHLRRRLQSLKQQCY